MSKTIYVTGDLKEAVDHILTGLPATAFYAEDGESALIHYSDETQDYFINVGIDEATGETTTDSLTIEHDQDAGEGWQTGYEF